MKVSAYSSLHLTAIKTVGLCLLLLTSNAYSRDTQHILPIDSALTSPAAKSKLDGSVRFYFAGDQVPAVSKTMMDVVSNRKTNAVGKADITACEWVFLSAMIALQDRAKLEGGNAVINITSYYKKNPLEAQGKYECHAGAIMAGVALKGQIVTLR